MVATHIVPMIVDALVESIQMNLVDDASEQGLSRVTMVKSGLLQEDKVENRISCGVTGGDTEKPDMLDGIMSLDSFPDVGAFFPPRELGGGQGWWRIGTVKIECFLLSEGLEELAARDAAYEALRRVIKTVRETQISHLKDDSLEHAIKLYVPSNTFSQGGGGPESFLFRGKITWMAATNVV